MHNILIADDDRSNLRLMNETLKLENRNIILVSNGKEAVDISNKEILDIIIMDIRMPIMNGIEAVKIIKEGRNRTTPVIFVTATDKRDKVVIKGYDAGAIDFLHKPLDSNIIRKKVQALISLYRCDGSRCVPGCSSNLEDERIVYNHIDEKVKQWEKELKNRTEEFKTIIRGV